MCTPVIVDAVAEIAKGSQQHGEDHPAEPERESFCHHTPALSLLNRLRVSIPTSANFIPAPMALEGLTEAPQGHGCARSLASTSLT